MYIYTLYIYIGVIIVYWEDLSTGLTKVYGGPFSKGLSGLY